MKTWGILIAFFIFAFVSPVDVLAAPITSGSFSTTWKTDNSGSSNSDQISFHLGTGNDGESCLGTLYWEELGNQSNNGSTTLDSPCNPETITFPSAGMYRVDISGDFPTFNISLAGDEQKILTVEQWGDNEWATLEAAFYLASNLTVPAVDAPDLSQATDLRQMFYGATSFNQSIDHWDVSTITSINGMFYNAAIFNQPLNIWDVSNVTDMSGTFGNAQSFNQPLNSWDVSSVTVMSNGNKARAIFGGATAFNQPLDNWDVSNVTDFSYLFQNATAFNQPLGTWNVSNATTMAFIFNAAEAFNQPLNTWSVSNVTTMESMFSGARVFNQSIGSWDVSNVTTMESMFAGAFDFNQSLDSWDVSSLTTTKYMFYFSPDFNQSLNNWNTAALQTTEYMFYFATDFNQSLYNWDVTNVENMDGMFPGTSLSTSNYSNMLTSWAARPSLQSDVYLDADIEYCTTAQSARDVLTNNYSWLISDNGSADCFNLVYTVGSNATLIGLASQNVVDGEDGISVEVIPNAGYRFVSWSDGRTDNPRSDTSITNDFSVAALLGVDPAGGSSGTRVGDRLQHKFTNSVTSSTESIILGESVFTSIRKFITHLLINEEQLATLPPEESKKVILLMRDIIVYLLTLLPSYE